MPLNNPAPQFGLLTEYDMRAYSGVEVFDRSGGSAVSLPTFASGEGVYEDAMFFLNRRLMKSDLSFEGQANNNPFVFGSSWKVRIDADDKIYVSSDDDFTLTHIGSIDALGFGSATLNATLVGSDYIVTAPNDWLRGELNLDDVSYRIDEVGGSGTFNLCNIPVYVQDASVGTRDIAVNDADEFPLTSLTELDSTAQSATDITWFIDSNGRVNCSYLSSIGHISWSSSEIRDLLGFTGDETPVTYATTYSLLTATHKAAGVLIPTRPYQQHHIRAENVAQSRRLIGGGYTSNHIGSYQTSVLSFDLDALLDSTDDYQHFIHRWVPYCSPGERVNFYQGWGDSRRALRTYEVTGSQDAYDRLYTSEDNGEYGRIRGSLTTESFDLVYPSRLKRRVPVYMEIEHL